MRPLALHPIDPAPAVNVLTVDVEDYFHASAFAPVAPRDQWPQFESRVVRNTDRLLEMFARAGARATFFVLGWVAQREAALVRRIAEAGHELASHSYWHRLVYDLTPAEFRQDLRQARDVIEQAAGVPVRGFRAPSFSVTRRSLWAFDVLAEEGYAYDASIFPIRHDRYGIPDAPRHPHWIERPAGQVLELPGTTVCYGRFRLPIGGGYFRLLPYELTRRAIRRLNASERQAAIFYVHPWEIDPDQPRLHASRLTRWRHYNQLGRTAARLERLLNDFQWNSVDAVLARPTAGVAAEVR